MFTEGGYWSDPAWAVGGDELFDRTGFQVLREWGDYVTRILYDHTDKPCRELLTLAQGSDTAEPRLVKAEARDVRDDYWKRV